ncbi:MAG: PAS domain-containing protein, partial [Paracoccaceae bacterium]
MQEWIGRMSEGHAAPSLAQGQALAIEILSDLLRATVDESRQAVDDALARLGPFLAVERVYVYRVDADAVLQLTNEWFADDLSAVEEEFRRVPVADIPDWWDGLKRDEPVDIPDVEALPDTTPWKSLLQKQDIRALLVLPIMDKENLFGLVGVDVLRGARQFGRLEIELLSKAADGIMAALRRHDRETAARRSASDLQAANGRLQAVLSAMPDLVLEVDADGRFLDVHSGPAELMLDTRENIIGRAMEDVLPPEVASLGRSVMHEVDEAGRSDNHTYPMTIRGRQMWFHLSASRRAAVAPGERSGNIFVIRDVTQEVDQRRAFERMGEIARRTSNLVLVTDTKGRIEWVNEAFAKRSGYSLEEARGKRPSELVQSPQTDPATRSRIRAALDAGEPVQGEILNR